MSRVTTGLDLATPTLDLRDADLFSEAFVEPVLDRATYGIGLRHSVGAQLGIDRPYVWGASDPRLRPIIHDADPEV